MMRPGHAAPDNVGSGEQKTSENGDHTKADRGGEPGASYCPGAWQESHLIDGIAAGPVAELAVRSAGR
jgi:hypothetical protein